MNRQALHSFKLGLISAALISMTTIAGETIDKTLATSATGFVDIDVKSGKVTLQTWDKNEVKVVGELDDDAEGYEFEVDGNKVQFKVKMPEKRWGSWNSSDNGSNLAFWLPVASKLKFEGVNVDVDVNGVTGGATVKTINGDIEAEALSHKVKLETVNGSVSSKNLSGKIGINTVNGEVQESGSKGQLTIETVNGDIKVNTLAIELALNNVNADMQVVANKVEDVEISTVNGDLDIELELVENGQFMFSSVSGDADISFNGEVSANFDIETHAGGDIDNYLSKQKAKKAKYGPSEKLKFKVGTGSADVEIDTVSGDIVIKATKMSFNNR